MLYELILTLDLACSFVQNADSKLPKIEVWLDGPALKTNGIRWPRFEDGKLQDCLSVEKPSHITINLPSGRKFVTWSKTVFVDTRNRQVWLVSTVPLAKRHTPFRQALTKIEAIATELGIKNDPTVGSAFKNWAKQQPKENSAFPLSTGASVEDNVWLRLEVRYNEELEGWYVKAVFNIEQKDNVDVKEKRVRTKDK